MKTIIRTTLILAVLIFGINTANAQIGPLSLGIKAGVNLSNVTDGDAKVGFNGGVTVDFALPADLYLMSGLEYSLKGAKIDEIDTKLNLSYLQLPVHLGYKLDIISGAKIVFHAGPYVGYAVDGKWKSGGVSVDAFGDEIAQVAGGIAKLKRFDFGVGLGAGVEFGKIGVGLGYDFGLADIYDGNLDGSIKNKNAYLTVGYKF
ncbi:MAG: PorT family protein [Prevotella sp.]|jgi:hypothetical protein|nr:PorT family protein [Prevotella sp.]